MAATLAGLLVMGVATVSRASDRPAPPVPTVAPQTQAETLYRQGMLQYHKGNYEAAIALYTDSLSLQPASAVTLSARAGAWGNLADYEAAIADYSAAIALDADLAPAYGGRGWARSLTGELNAGVSDLWIAAQLFRAQDQLEQYFQTLAIIHNLAP